MVILLLASNLSHSSGLGESGFSGEANAWARDFFEQDNEVSPFSIWLRDSYLRTRRRFLLVDSAGKWRLLDLRVIGISYRTWAKFRFATKTTTAAVA
jgi:hypothetical protein